MASFSSAYLWPARYSLTDCCLGPLTMGSPPPCTPCPDGVLPSEATWRPAAAEPPEGWLAGLRPRSSDWVWAAALRWSLAWWSLGWVAPRAWLEGWLGLAGYESDAIDLLGGKMRRRVINKGIKVKGIHNKDLCSSNVNVTALIWGSAVTTKPHK